MKRHQFSLPDLEVLRRQYVEHFGIEGVPTKVINEIERLLEVLLPNDLKEISTFYGGGIVGEISHFAFTIGPANNVAEETLGLRGAIGLPHQYVVLAEPPDSIIVLDCEAKSEPAIIWFDAGELQKLPAIDSLTTPDIWQKYVDFFAYLLNQEKAHMSKSTSQNTEHP
jgi:hypothetical protein